jgi:hypothetical protein
MFERTPQGMFMLQIMFGYSKYYVDNLSENVKRGLRKKIALGWLPGMPPLGYINDKTTGTIIPDPERFEIVREMWTLLLAGVYSRARIRKIATDHWNLRTPIRRKSGGNPVALSTIYRMFSNPFYAGILVCQDGWKEGNHPAMISMDEFTRAQSLNGRKERAKPKNHEFAYTGGIIRCSCGLSITAEEKIKPSGRCYTYYRCTRRLRPSCTQPAIRLESLESAIADFLGRICLPPMTEEWLKGKVANGVCDLAEAENLRKRSADSRRSSIEQELGALLDMRTRRLIDDDEFVAKRRELQTELLRLRKSVIDTHPGDIRLELAACVNLFRKYAVDWFLSGSLIEKRMILQTVGSNCLLSDKKLSIQARIPFELAPGNTEFPIGSGTLEYIRTLESDTSEANHIITAVRYLEKCADARKSGVTLPPLPVAKKVRRRSKQRSVYELRKGMEEYRENTASSL